MLEVRIGAAIRRATSSLLLLGDSSQDRTADVVNLKLDREYLPGEKAVVS